LEEGVVDVGAPDGCAHLFCWPCINTWAATSTTCPSCRARFAAVRHIRRGAVVGCQRVPERTLQWRPDASVAAWLDALVCQICNSAGDDEALLLCDGCDRGFHTFCLGLRGVPHGNALVLLLLVFWGSRGVVNQISQQSSDCVV
jgi:hypothetical protein